MSGAPCLDIRAEKLVVVECPAFILATGGNLELYYPHADGSCDVTGDGSAPALRAGAECVDMEFQQLLVNAVSWLEDGEIKVRHEPVVMTRLRPEEVDKKWLDLEKG